ncbi:MAG: DUF2721 domain-containing protein [Phycisphaeraceae bacterium]
MPNVVQVIQLLVAPVVMISACGLLCLALYNRLGTIVGRARAFLKERFDAVDRLSAMELDEQTSAEAHLIRKRLGVLEAQVRHIVARARLVRAGLFCLLATVLCMLACSIALGLSLLVPIQWAAVVFFAMGVVAMGAGTTLAMIELMRALDPLVIEQTGMIE